MGKRVHTLIAAGAILGASTGAVAEDAFIESLKAGKVIVDARLRYERVDDSINKDADGLTLRTRLGYQTGSISGFKVLGEFSDTRPVFGINDYAPEKAGYAVIADPAETDLNRVVVSYEGFDNTWLGIGRQRIILDNARWVGNVGWRQKEQTFDAASADFNMGDNWKLSYDYMNHVSGVVEDLDRDVRNHIVNVAFSGWDLGTLVGYGYFLKDDENDDTNNSIGLRFSGGTQPSDLNWLYAAELARQSADFKHGSDFNTYYLSLMGGVGFNNMTVKVGYEVLSSDGGDYGLQTPLATKHGFNGWADLFLGTPDDGLRDLYVDFGANWLDLKWGAVLHDFRSDKGSDKYGSELDLLVSKTFNKHYTVGVKYADYRADDFSEDRRKLWLWFDFKY